MTQEQKAKAYDEALERARQIKDGKDEWRYSDLAEITPALTEIFPELRESEDERIRKALVWHLKAGENFVSNGVTREECIAYLEKQEQKSIEDVVKDVTKNKESATKFLKSAGIMDDNGELAEMYRSEQKPVEWSEEDEKRIKQLIYDTESIRAGYEKRKEKLGDEFNNELIKDCDAQIAWLKSLRPSWKPSEEQMKALLNTYPDYPYYCELKSLYEELKKL